ncbi:MAG: tetratricopeptide repeat protein [Phycisphaerae bacterium]
MITRAKDSPDAWPDPADADFAFLGSDDAWLERLRAAEAPRGGLNWGPYELLGEIRRGAQGVVVRVRDPRDGRVLALKRLLAGPWAAATQRARFEREIELAASLEHPNVVATCGVEYVEGQPVVAMEWIDGEPVDRWAQRSDDGRRRPLPEVLDVFLQVCDGVHHAHQRGVIHRDLKPGNILVVDKRGGAGEQSAHGEHAARADRDVGPGSAPRVFRSTAGAPRARVLDFGIAQSAHPRADGQRLTETGGFVGTPAYAAPEQLTGRSTQADVRIDVYALGVLLYELTTGRLPFSADAGVAALFDAIRSHDPAPPSRYAAGGDGDLDAIVLKALARDPTRRYPSVDAFATDLRRYRAGEPIEARRGQRWYALRTLARRHRVAGAVALAFLIVVSGAAAALAVLYSRQARVLAQMTAACDAETAARRDEQRALATIEQLLQQVAEVGTGADLALRRQRLADAERMVRAELADAPAALARAYDALGRAYGRFALYDDGERLLRVARDLSIRAEGRASLAAAARAASLAELLQARTRYRDAEPLFREALEIRTRLCPADHPDVARSLQHLGTVLSNREQYAAALEAYEHARALRTRTLGAEHPDSIASLVAVGCAHANLNHALEAETCLRAALALQLQTRGPEHYDTAGRHIDLGKILLATGQWDEAETHLRRGLALYRELLGGRHDNVAWAAHRLGTLLHARGRFVEADALLVEAGATYRDVLGPDSPFVGFVAESRAKLLEDMDCPDAAAAEHAEAARVRARAAPAHDAD